MRLALAGLALLAAGVAHAEPPASVMVGNHPGFGRIVFDLRPAATVQVAEHAGTVTLVFAGGGAVGMPDWVPRNVISVVGGDGSATVMIAPGARIRSARMGGKLVLDVLDPARRARPAPRSLEPAPLPSAATPLPAAEPAAPPASPRQEPAPVEPASAGAGEPAPQLATPASVPAPAVTALQLAAAPAVGAAAFRRDGLGILVLDDLVTIEPEQLARVQGFSAATVSQVGKATVLTVQLTDQEALAVTREPAGWRVTRGPAVGPAVPQSSVPDGIVFQFAQPGRALSIRDPVTGQALLIGTSRQPAGPGPQVTIGRSAPGYALLPTWLGIALEPNSDRVDLRASTSGFTLVTPDSSSPAKLAAAGRESRFGLPTGPVPVLLQQLRAHLAGAASVPPRGRGPERVAAARTMLSLGMAAEAQALLTRAAEDDPAVAADPLTGALSGMAAVLASRPTETAGLDNPALGTGEELALWRGLRDAAQGKPAEALAKSVDLVLSYPDALQRRILPLAVEAAVRDSEPLLTRTLPDMPALAFARAMSQERAGETDAALAAYDRIDSGRDRSDSVRAALAAAGLRFAKGLISAQAAADLVERQAVRWRGDARELSMRLRLAELRTQAGQWRPALKTLRETETLFPDARPDIGSRKAAVFKALLAGPKEELRPLELVTLAGDFADCVPDGDAGQAVAALLADKLAALDLPSRAGPVLQKLMQQTAASGAKAEFAMRLAQLDLDNGEPARAGQALQGLASGDLPPESAERRTLLLARSRAGQGDVAGAVAHLAALGSPAADELRAELLHKSGDWRGSLAALKELAAKTVPNQGELTEKQQDVVLREAAAAAQAGDDAMLSELQPMAARIGPPRADLFRMLTASALTGPADLPRAARELAMSRSLSARLDTLAHR